MQELLAQWDINTAKVCALEIEDCLSNINYSLFLKSMLIIIV